MSYEYEDSNIMSAFFHGKIKAKDIGPKYERVEVGHGIGIGHRDGSYSQYIKQLSDRSAKGNGLIYIGKTITEDKNIMSMTDETEKFDIGDVPKLLITFHNVLNERTIKVEWKNMDDENILEQYYQIPLPYSMNYNWWDAYYTHFIGPEDLEEGNYKVQITTREIVRNRTPEELSSTIEFSVRDND